jgi:hypothetical protein
MLDMARANCRGEMATVAGLMRARLESYPQSSVAERQYAASLVRTNRPKAALEILRGLDPLDPWWGWAPAPDSYWAWTAVARHLLGQHVAELEITERWRDSAAGTWRYIRGRALAALGRDRDALELFHSLIARPMGEVTGTLLTMAGELAIHGHQQTAMAVAESLLVRLEAGSGLDSAQKWKHIVWANRLLGRRNEELAALERMAPDDVDLDRLGRIAVLRGDTAEADRIDGTLAEQGREPLRNPDIRGRRLLARAHIAVGLGRRDQAVEHLREAVARGLPFFESVFHAIHIDPLLAPLRGYPPFEALVKPDG